ncbi:ATP-binding cassette domain-containing protein [Bailinhaonella thermotolerans]|uniref:ATP-binding cassette domain-containing protein n=1 Tax=Bailinhaonella thermotolerans TaxID=1070861 RepID=A0A3A4AYJ7_9ACTN|nr:ATP-binding cassette domain-containing protein [Bailinhaonella thermotolerans]RJL35427.1 ATP-binding cassette domain-containing protein [Bailinhaonella thermotolerans]
MTRAAGAAPRLEVPVRRHVLAALGCGWLTAAGLGVCHVGTGRLIDDIAGTGRPWQAAALMGSGIALAAAGVLGQGLANGRGEAAAEAAVRARIHRFVLAGGARGEPAGAGGPVAGGLASLATDGAAKVAAWRGGFLGALVSSATTPLVVVAIVAWLAGTAAALTLLAVVVTVPPVIGGFLRLSRASSNGHQARSRRLAAHFLESVRGLRLLTLLGAAERRSRLLAAESERQRRATMRLLAGNQVVLLVTDVVFHGGLIGAGAALALSRHASGAISAGTAVALVLISVLLTEPIGVMGRFFYIAMTGRAAGRQILGVLSGGRTAAAPGAAVPAAHAAGGRTPADPARRTASGAAAGRAAPAAGGSAAARGADSREGGGTAIELVEVTAGHGDGPAVLEGITLRVGRGEMVALAGPSGAGKSTLLSVVAGELTPRSGTVRLPGPGGGAARAALVPQRPWLFTGTVAGNLRLADPAASERRLWEVLERARLAEEVRAMPGGLGARVGDEGLTLSGGQAQRLALARALLLDACVLLLDEPTSHIDPRAEELIIESLRRLRGERTILVATHSAALRRAADRVVAVTGAPAVTA